MKAVYLIPLLLYSLLNGPIVQGAGLKKYANAIANKFLTTKSLPFEDCDTPCSDYEVANVTLTKENFRNKEIQQFISKASLTFFEACNISIDFLKIDPQNWKANKSFQEAKKKVQQLQVVNDVAERGVALANTYINVTTSETDYQNLLQGSKYLIFYLNISSCTSIPCVMLRGTTVEVNVLFDDDNDNTQYLKHRVRWIFNAIKTNAFITPDPCDGVKNCLSNDHEGKIYWVTVLVNKTLPAISGTMLWEVVNEHNEGVICFKVPVVITI